MSEPTTFNRIFGAPEHPSPLESSALILIDIQREYLNGKVPLSGVTEAAREAGRLLDLARRNDVPIFHVAHRAPAGAPAFNPDGPYVDFLPEVAPLEGETIVWKAHSDAFLGTGLADMVRATGRSEVIIAGDTTGVCVSTSTRTANEAHGFRVTVVADATATRDVPNPLGGVIDGETLRAAALAELADGFAVVVKNADAWSA